MFSSSHFRLSGHASMIGSGAAHPSGGQASPRLNVTVAGHHTTKTPPDRRLTLALLGMALVVLLGIGSYAIWLKLTYRPDPGKTVESFLAAAKVGDYDRMETFAQNKEHAAQLLERQRELASKFPQIEPVVKQILESVQFKVGVSKMDGDNATVPVTATLGDGSATTTANIRTKYIGGAWKISEDNKEFEQAMMHLVGPAVMKTGVVDDLLKAIQNGEVKLPTLDDL